MKSFLAGTLFGIVLSGLAGTGLLYKMGKLESTVERVKEKVFERAAVAPNEPIPVAAAPQEPSQIAEPKPDDPEPVRLGIGAVINKPLFSQPDNPWNQDISKEPVDRLSNLIIARIGANRPLHPEFGTTYRGAPNGIPYVVVA